MVACVFYPRNAGTDRSFRVWNRGRDSPEWRNFSLRRASSAAHRQSGPRDSVEAASASPAPLRSWRRRTGPGGVFLTRAPPMDLHPHDFGASRHGLADMAQADDSQPLAAEGGGNAACGQAPFARSDRAVALGDLTPRGQDQADGVVGHVFVVHAGRMGDGQAARAAPFDVDAVVSGGEAGDQRQIGQALDQRLVQFELARDDQSTDVMRGLDRRAFPEAIDIIGAFQKGAQRGQMPLHDQDGGTLGFEVALEPFHMAVAFEGQDVGGQTVQEPAVVADDHGAAGELFQSLFEVLQGFDVQVVGRFVEQDQVAAGGQGLGQVDAVTLAARQLADLLLLVAALEVERTHIGARVDLALADREDVGAAGDGLPDGVVRLQVVARLIDVGQLDRFADLDRAAVGRFLTGDHLEQGRFTGTVRTNNTNDTARRQLEDRRPRGRHCPGAGRAGSG
uniref:LigA n=1 Tax=Parastrongyloides trichosuri TaxID=131310 RepID=A0A0N4ZXP3_PARTI